MYYLIWQSFFWHRNFLKRKGSGKGEMGGGGGQCIFVYLLYLCHVVEKFSCLVEGWEKVRLLISLVIRWRCWEGIIISERLK